MSKLWNSDCLIILDKLLHAIWRPLFLLWINLYFFYVCISWIKLAHVRFISSINNSGMEIQDGSLVLHIWCKPAAIVALFYVVIPFSLASYYFVFPPATKKRTSTHWPNAALSLFINFHYSIFMKSDNWYYKNTFWAKCTHMLVKLLPWTLVKIWMAKFNYVTSYISKCWIFCD